MNEALWSSDASFFRQGVDQDGKVLELYNTDGQKEAGCTLWMAVEMGTIAWSSQWNL